MNAEPGPNARSHPLVRSEAAARILALLTALPGEELHTNEIMRRTQTNANAAQRALERLEAGGVLRSRRLGNLRLWSITREHPLYASLRDLFGRTRGIPMLLQEKLSEDSGIALAFLFGSYVTARDDPSSDIDLFVVGKPNAVTLDRVTEEVAKQLRRQVNVVAWTPQDLGTPTPAQRAFLESVTSRPKIWLIGGEDELERRRRRVGAAVERGRRTDTRQSRSRPRASSAGRAQRSSGERGTLGQRSRSGPRKR
ncbi:MAG TPA: nucleotidyltransferase domain-containing protein [Candidatus Limnocylindria bacterium]|nr:nucleotidyltransferase domain-containing protein [Candidatus Limnocylindria bacterium]